MVISVIVWYDITIKVMKEFLQSHHLPPLPCVSVLRFVWISYTRLIPTDCANGYEVVKLLDSQLDASSSYAEGPTEADKTQSRIDHMPSMGQINNTKGRGSSLFYRQHCRWGISIYTLSDLGVSSNLIGSLSLTEHYSPPTELIICEPNKNKWPA